MSEVAENVTLVSPDNSSSMEPPVDQEAPESAEPTLDSGVKSGHRTVSVPPGYDILGELGRGGMGVVYKAVQSRVNRIVALKMVLGGGHAEPTQLARFLREARAVAHLRHDNIVQLYEAGEHEGLPYFSLEWVAGGSLDRRPRPLLPREAARLIEQIAHGVEHAHQHGIIHRDLKPANILLQSRGPSSPVVPKITDFGLARSVQEDSRLTGSGAVLGTPAYMAPEQGSGDPRRVGPATDVYALGALLYDCLTGRPPFQGPTPMNTLQQVLTTEPVPPTRLQPTIPRDLETICLKCLQKDPQRRYASAVALAEDLRRFQAGEPITARPVGPLERGWRWCRRQPLVAGLVAAVAGSLLLGTAVAVGLAWHAQVKAEEALEQKQRAEDARTVAENKTQEAEAARTLAEQEQSRAAKELLRSEGLLYASRIAWAQREWHEGNFLVARDVLDLTRPDFRGWEYRYLHTLFWHQGQRTIPEHALFVTSVAYSPDGQRLASGSAEGTVKVRDVRTGQVLYQWRMPGGVRGLAFSPDGQYLAAGCLDGRARVWDLRTGKPGVDFLNPSGPVTSVAFSPDSRWLASASEDKTVKVWDVRTGQLAGPSLEHKFPVSSVVFSADGQRLITSCGGFPPPTRKGGQVTVWDAGSHQPIRILKGREFSVQSLAVSPDGKRIAGGGWSMLKVWDAGTGAEVHTLKGHVGMVASLAFSPDSKHLVSACSDKTIKVWDVRTGEPAFALLGHTAGVRSVAFRPDGDQIASAGDDHVVKVWVARLGQQPVVFRGHKDQVLCLAFSPDGQRIASGGWDHTIKVWDARTGQERLAFAAHTNWITSLAFSPDGQALASASTDKTVKVWDARTGQQTLSLESKAAIRGGVAFSPDGRQLAWISAPRTVRVWDRQAGKEVFLLDDPSGDIHGLAFSPDGQRLVTGGTGKRVLVWDSQTGQRLHDLAGHGNPVMTVAFSPDSRSIVSTSSDKTVRVWDARYGKQTLLLEGHTATVYAAAFSPDGQRIASTGVDRSLKVWDAHNGQLMLDLPAHSKPATSLAFSPDGHRIATGSTDNTVTVWDASAGK